MVQLQIGHFPLVWMVVAAMRHPPLTFEAFWRQQQEQAAAYDRYDDDYHRQVVRNIVSNERAMRELYGRFPPHWWVWEYGVPLRLLWDRR